jgi:hypothetical protein
LCLTDLTGIRIDHRNGRAAVIDKQLIARQMRLAHGTFLLFQPSIVVLAELRIGISLLTILLVIFLPEQHFGHPFAFQIQKASCKIRHHPMRLSTFRPVQNRCELLI